eukprot:scaffold50_cov162-Ochromonas_danica.AAC.14
MSKSSGSGGVSPFNMNCNYYNAPTYNKQVLAGMCATFKKMGCCAASGVQIVIGNQMNSSALVVLPPCLHNFLAAQCPAISMSKPCTTGAITTQSVIRGYIILPRSAGRFINVYDKANLVTAQGVISTVLTTFNAALKKQPYNINPTYPFQVSIVGYSYSNDTHVLTPTTGVMQLRAVLSIPTLAQGFAQGFGVTTQAGMAVAKTALTSSALYHAEPVAVEHSGSGSFMPWRGGNGAIVIGLVTVFAYLLY